MIRTCTILLCAASLCACDMIPPYRVYNARKTGEAELAQADGNRQIKIQEAKAAYESADYLAKAEIRKAEGVAQANRIMSAYVGSTSKCFPRARRSRSSTSRPRPPSPSSK